MEFSRAARGVGPIESNDACSENDSDSSEEINEYVVRKKRKTKRYFGGLTFTRSPFLPGNPTIPQQSAVTIYQSLAAAPAQL